jgi:hypothetical protein
MLASYQLDRAQRNLSGYTVLGVPRPLGVRTLNGLGAAVPITGAQALQMALKAYAGKNLNPKDDYTNPGSDGMTAQIEAGQFNLPYPGCTGQAPNLNMFSTASGLALGTTTATVGFLGPSGAALIPASAVPVIGWAIAGVGAIIGLIGAIFSHHKAAVQRDMNFICGALPAVNNAFQVIAQAVANGQMKPADAAAALPQIYSEFMQAGGASGSISGPGSIPGSGAPINNHPYCNAACELSLALLGMVFFWQAQYAAMAAQPVPAPAPAPAAIAPVTPPATASTPAQPGSGSAGAGPSAAPIVSSGSTLKLPGPAAAAPSTSLPSWMFLAAAAVVGLVAAEVF